jgi:hypothetical protein
MIRIELEILDWKARGRSIEDTYIYFKDFVTVEDVLRLFNNRMEVV